MLAVGVSYRQTIRAYPHGGGSYIVASDNLGRMPGLVAAAGLMTDYILTVAVSVASGVAAVTSAIPSLGSGHGRDRGGRDRRRCSPATCAACARPARCSPRRRTCSSSRCSCSSPSGLIDAAGRGFHADAAGRPLTATEGVGVLLVLRAFASGSTAMTGIEAISNAVPAFKPTEWRNARTTLTWMVGLLIALFAGTIAMVAARRGRAQRARNGALAARAPQLRLGLHVPRHAGGDRGDPAARREHRLQRLPARAVPAGA